MRKIQLTQGEVAFVDDDDYERVSAHKWGLDRHKSGKKYAIRMRKKREHIEGMNLSSKIRMHRFVSNIHMIPGANVVPDHIDGNGLNNQKSNLLVTTMALNLQRRSVWGRPKSSIYKGVYKDKKRKTRTWIARIGTNYKQLYLGAFELEVDAAKAYDIAAEKHFGNFAIYNLPQEVKNGRIE